MTARDLEGIIKEKAEERQREVLIFPREKFSPREEFALDKHKGKTRDPIGF